MLNGMFVRLLWVTLVCINMCAKERKQVCCYFDVNGKGACEVKSSKRLKSKKAVIVEVVEILRESSLSSSSSC